jgi:hypothetical protein
MDTSIVKFNVADSAIAEMGAKYLPLVINGIEDKVGFQMVHAARMEVKRTRLEVEKTRKDLKADALRYSQAVDGEARRITALLEPIESHLEGQELAVIKAKEKIKLEEEATKDRLAQERVDAMQLFGVSLSFMMARSMTPEAFAQAFKIAEEQHSVAEAHRKKAQEEAAREAERREIERKAEEARLAEERKRQEIEQAELKASRQKLIDERIALEKEIQKIEAQKAEKARQEEIEQAKKEAADKAVLEAQEKAKAESEARAKAEAEAEAERQRLEAQRPDVIKLRDLAMKIHTLEIPAVKSEQAVTLAKECYRRLAAVERFLLREIVHMESGDADA